MRTVGLFGGSFNPPHAGHQLVALYALETHPIDELWFVPVFEHPLGKHLAAYADRVAMCELAIAALGPRARVSRAEQALATRTGSSTGHTIDLVEDLIATHADTQFRLVIGSDLRRDVESWHRWDELRAHAPLIVIGRGGHAASTDPDPVTMPGISATAIRAQLLQHPSDVELLAPRGVLQHISERGLYGVAPKGGATR